MLPRFPASSTEARLDSIQRLPPNLMYYAMMKDPEFKGMVNPVPDSVGVRMVGRFCRGPSVQVTGNDTLVYLNLGSECAIINFADPAHPQVLSEIPAADRSFRSVLRDSLLFIGGCGIDIWNVKHPTMPQFVSRINLTVSDIAVQDSFLYTVNADSFRVFCFANPLAPVQVGASDDTGASLSLARGYAYICGVWTMSAVDVSDPRHPHRAGTFNQRVGLTYARDTLLYATTQSGVFEIINVSDPSNMRVIGSLQSLTVWGYVDVRDFFAYLPNFAIVDVGDPTNPTIISQLPMPGFESNSECAVWVRDPWSYAYVAGSGDGLQIVDIHDPVHPVRDTTILRGGVTQDIAVRSPVAALVSPDAGLHVIDVSDVSLPREVGAYDTVCGYWWDLYGVAMADSNVFTSPVVAPVPMRSINVADPAHPFLAGASSQPTRGMPKKMVIRGTLLYAAEESRLQIFDISSPTAPQLLGEVRTPSWVDGMCLHDTLAYLGNDGDGLLIVNVAHPANPRVVDTVAVPDGGAREVVVRDTIAFVTAADSGLRIINVKNPHAPIAVSSVPIMGASGILVIGNLAYVGCRIGLTVIDVSDLTNPVQVGYYYVPSGCGPLVADSSLIYAVLGTKGYLVFQPLYSAIQEKSPERATPPVKCISSVVGNRVLIRTDEKKGGDLAARVFDVHGRLMLHETLAPASGSSSVSLDLSKLPNGVFFVQVSADGQVTSQKIAKIAD